MNPSFAIRFHTIFLAFRLLDTYQCINDFSLAKEGMPFSLSALVISFFKSPTKTHPELNLKQSSSTFIGFLVDYFNYFSLASWYFLRCLSVGRLYFKNRKVTCLCT